MKRKLLLSIALAMMMSQASAQQSLRRMKMENDTLREHFSTIAGRVMPIAKEHAAEYRLRYKIPGAKYSKLSYYVCERDLRKSCYDYVYRDSLLKRVRCKMEIDSIYRDSINTILIPIKGSRVSGDNISLALMYSRVLELDDAQYQCIMDRALDMARRIHANPRLNVWNEEMNVLRNTLTQQQLALFFFNKNAESVTKEMDKGWQKIVDAGLAEQLDSVQEYSLAFTYYHERQKIKDLYRYYGTSQKRYLAELDKHKPSMVKMLDTINRNAKDATEEEKQKRNTKYIGKEFVW